MLSFWFNGHQHSSKINITHQPDSHSSIYRTCQCLHCCYNGYHECVFWLRSESGSPKKFLVVQHAGQFTVERLVEFPEQVSGGWKHGPQVPVGSSPCVQHRPLGQRRLSLLGQRTCRRKRSSRLKKPSLSLVQE